MNQIFMISTKFVRFFIFVYIIYILLLAPFIFKPFFFPFSIKNNNKPIFILGMKRFKKAFYLLTNILDTLYNGFICMA